MFRLFFATVLVVASFGQTALATEDPIFPMLYHVDGVAEGGVLNIRAEPAMKAEVIGTLDAAARNVEVIEAQGGWGRINVHERTGWVAMRFLSAPSNPWRDNGTPKLLRCFGTEPFWHATVDLSKQQLRLVNLAEGEVVKAQDIKHVVAGYQTCRRGPLSHADPRHSVRRYHADGDAGAMFGRDVGLPLRSGREPDHRPVAGRSPATHPERLLLGNKYAASRIDAPFPGGGTWQECPT